MSSRLRFFVAVPLLLVLVTACGGPRYSTDYAPNVDFSKYRTFAWSPHGNNLPEDPRYNTSLVDARLVDGIEYALKAKGLTMVAAEDADLHVVYHAIVQQKTSYTTVNAHYGYSPYWGGYGRWGGWGYGAGTTYENNYDEGTLVVDLLENVPGAEERIVWRGAVTDTIKKGDRDPMQAQRETREGAVDLFAEYPPGR
jgi:hypothetical protein